VQPAAGQQDSHVDGSDEWCDETGDTLDALTQLGGGDHDLKCCGSAEPITAATLPALWGL
jgi:hypothetical protein